MGKDKRPDWDEIEYAFVVEGKPLTQIAKETQVSYRSVRGRAIAEGWGRYHDGGDPLIADHETLKLFNKMISEEIHSAKARLERLQVADDGGVDQAAVRDREVRGLINLFKAFERISDMKRKIADGAAEALEKSQAEDMRQPTADEMRREIKRRLNRLADQAAQGKLA